MKKFVVSTTHPYEILIGENLIEDAGTYIKQIIKPCRLCIITDSTVNSIYAQILSNTLTENGFLVSKVVFPSGEHSKNINTFSNVLEALGDEGFTRSDAIIALGGGVVGDLAGFSAATYMRGIRYIQIPTTYLAAIDASVGGKTGINLLCGKNLAGAFWQPDLVLCDYKTFETLPSPRLLEGVSEAVKNAVVSDASLLKYIQQNDYEYVIERCISIKKSIVEADERDTGLRQLLNFGHTIGHGIEKLSAFSVSHGLAVAKGMVVEARSAYRSGLTETDVSTELETILEDLGFDLSMNYSAKDLYACALTDKKIMCDKITMVIPEALGKCRLHKIKLSELEEFIQLGLN